MQQAIVKNALKGNRQQAVGNSEERSQRQQAKVKNAPINISQSSPSFPSPSFPPLRILYIRTMNRHCDPPVGGEAIRSITGHFAGS